MIGKSLLSVLAGAVVCCFAAAAVSAEEAKKPWYEETFPQLINAAGETVPASKLTGKIVGVYFSASESGRSFTPRLVEFYLQGAVRKENFEIVFVSCDKTSDDMKAYMNKDSMPWAAIPFGDASAGALKRKLGIRGAAPTLVIFGNDGRIISKNARWDVMMLGPKALDAWRSPDYKPKTDQDFRNSFTKKTRKSIKVKSKAKSRKSKAKARDNSQNKE